MSRIRSRDTKPELRVRSLLHKMGYRFRLHRRDLPGSPDIVLPKYKTVIFVHGCFWHLHRDCKASMIPKTDSKKWEDKLLANEKRDKQNIRLLQDKGWRVFIIWQCQIKDAKQLKERLFLLLS